jgi:hypothetical protein
MTTQLTPQEQYRIYGVVLRHLSPIQKGIQFNHAVVALGFEHGLETLGLNANEPYSSVLLQCNSYDELEVILSTIIMAKFPVAVFAEPDLNGLVTAIAFQVPMQWKFDWDERVLSMAKTYPPEFWTVLNNLKLAY